jgi:Flp pilus assembly secretin CpaC
MFALHSPVGLHSGGDGFEHKDRRVMTHVFAEGASLRQVLAAAVLGSFALVAGTAMPSAQMLDDIIVKYDQSQLLPLPRQASEIIVGNPVIADITVQAGDLLVVTGKSFGITNMIVLDAKREVILERRVLVKREDVRVVNLQRGTQRQTFNCTPQCNPTVTIGDDPAYFDSTLKAAEKKAGMSEKAADSGSQGNSQ